MYRFNQNLRGPKLKADETICANDFHSVCHTETWLDESVYASELFCGHNWVSNVTEIHKHSDGGKLNAVSLFLTMYSREERCSVAANIWVTVITPCNVKVHIYCVHIVGETNLIRYEAFDNKISDIVIINPDHIFLIAEMLIFRILTRCEMATLMVFFQRCQMMSYLLYFLILLFRSVPI